MKKTQQSKFRPMSDSSGNGRGLSAPDGHNSRILPGQASGKRPDGKKKKGRINIWRILWIAGITIIAASVVAVLAVYLLWSHLLGQVHVINPTDETIPSEFNVPTESLAIPVPVEKGIINILLLGVDTRNEDSFAERSDSMMILTIDEKNDRVKLTSLQRDMLVYIPGRKEPARINTANALGGPLLALRVVNETFRLSIDQYMVINMSGMEKMIDLAGGVMVDVEAGEIYYLNENINETNSVYPDTPPAAVVKKAGLQRLGGRQAVAYARIRKLDSDYKRMERQRTVLQALFKQFLSADLITKKNVMTKGLGLITTNINTTRLTDLGLKILPMMNADLDQMQIPIKGYFQEYSGESWFNLCDFNGMIPFLQQFIFGRTYAFDPVKVIPGAPNSGIKLPTPTPTRKPTPTPTSTPPPTPTPAPTPTPTPTATTQELTTSTIPLITTASQEPSESGGPTTSSPTSETTKDPTKPPSGTPAITTATIVPTTTRATTAPTSAATTA